jgi:hypothetical protein
MAAGFYFFTKYAERGSGAANISAESPQFKNNEFARM